jgi:hypothetical protein
VRKIKKRKFKNLEDVLQSLNNDEIIVLSYSSIEEEENKRKRSLKRGGVDN